MVEECGAYAVSNAHALGYLKLDNSVAMATEECL